LTAADPSIISPMKRAFVWFLPVMVWLSCVVGIGAQGRQGGGRGGAWTIPPTAADEKSPLTVNDAVVAAGKKLFADKCQRCHGVTGKGDGPEGEPEHQADMDLTVASRAARNPDGVVFYKIWNGRQTPKMPVFSEELTKEQAWAIVAYVQTLRGK
jgi:mono/diheme cytochrome c family protein